MVPLFETIIDYIPAPEGDPEANTQVLISTIDYNEYVGRIGVGKVDNGVIRVNQDVVICNHILEHVEDDRKALRELHRILRPNGWGVVLVPQDYERETTFEDDSITSPEERARIFGQYDHRRIYGRDYAQRVAECGFEVEEIDYEKSLSEEERKQYATAGERLYIVYKI